MKNRYLPYGYKIEDGIYVTDPAEADVVREIFRLYRGGHSYKAIAGILNAGSYPAHSASGWNKHHIKRMLENSRYTGGGLYPAILSDAQFAAARVALDGKTDGWASWDGPGRILWSRIVCGECGGKMRRAGNRLSAKGVARLQCANPVCGHSVGIAVSTLWQAVACMQQRASEAPAETVRRGYEPGPEVLRLGSRISRAIARPDDPAEAVRLILRGIGARYGDIPSSPTPANTMETDDESRLSEPDWELFGRAVSHISLSHMGIGMKTITGREYFMERTDKFANDCNNAAAEGSDRHSRESAAEPIYGAAGEWHPERGRLHAGQHQRQGPDQQL